MKQTKYIVLIIAALAFHSCNSDTTTMDSDDFGSRSDRVEALKTEIISSSEFIDAEFEMINANGFSNTRVTLPGASYWDYKIALKLKSSDLVKWTEGMIEVQLNDYDDSWTKEIVKQRKKNWNTSLNPKYYKREGDEVILLVFESEGIIFKRIIQG